jgi:Flp pilus assembly protein TadD
MRRAVLALLLALAPAGCKSTPEPKADLPSHRDPASFHRSMAYTLLRTSQPERAVPHIQRLLHSQPNSAEGHYLMGRAMLGMDLLQPAATEIEKAIALDAKFAPALSLLGLLLDRRGEHAGAERAHHRALQLDGKSAAYHNNLGFCLYLQKRFGEAIAAYRQALQLDPTARRVNNNLAFAYAKMGDLGQAQKHFAIAGDVGQVNNNMGLVYESMGKLEQAYEHYQKAASDGQPAPAQAQENLARVCAKLGRPVPATKKLQTPQTGSTMP